MFHGLRDIAAYSVSVTIEAVPREKWKAMPLQEKVLGAINGALLGLDVAVLVSIFYLGILAAQLAGRFIHP